MIYSILPILLFLMVPAIWITSAVLDRNKIIKKNKQDKQFLENWIILNSSAVELKVENFLKTTKNEFDKYEIQIKSGQDKYQIGKALYRFISNLTDGLDMLFDHGIPFCLVKQIKTLPNIKQCLDEIENIRQKTTDLIRTDILIENGYKDLEEEIKHREKQSKHLESIKNNIKDSNNKKEEEIKSIEKLVETIENENKQRKQINSIKKNPNTSNIFKFLDNNKKK